MRRGVGIVLCALAVLPAAAAAQAPGDLMGRPVDRVIVDVDGVRTDDPMLLGLIVTRPGAPLEARAVRESVAHLFGVGRFDDVRVHATAAEAGAVVVRYELVGSRRLADLRFSGTLGVGDGELRRAIGARFGLAAALTSTSDLARFLEGFYQERGFLQATVSATTQEGGGPLVVHIEAGPRATLGALRVEGNAPGSLAKARAALGLTAGQVYDARRVTTRLNDYVASLREQGYYEAQAEHEVLVADDGRSIELVVTIDAGPHVTVVFEGDPVPLRVRRDLVPIEREGSVDEDLLEDAARNIADYFRAQGYRDASVSFRRADRAGELAIVFDVHRGPAYRIGTVDVQGNESVPLSDLAPVIGLKSGAPFLDAQLDADVNALRSVYRRLGYTAVRIQSAAIPEPGPAPVETTVRIIVTEGPRTLVNRILIAGNTALDERALRAVIGTEPGHPLFEPQLALDRDAIALQFLNRGYARAEVSVGAQFSDDRTRADLTFTVRQGPQVFVEHVLVVGNERTSADTIRREIVLQPGDPLSFEGLAESQRRVSALGLFRRVRITEIDHGAESRRDLLVTVEEAPATSLGYGGGLEAGRRLQRTPTDGGAPDERIEVAPRGFFEIGRRNLFGGNRSVHLFTRLSLRLRSDPVLTRDGEQPATDFNEYRVIGTYRQPRLLRSADFVATGVLEQGARTSFDFSRRGVRAELARRIRPTVSVAGRYALERTEVFNETVSGEDQYLIDRLFPEVRLSTLSASVIRDTRDDVLGPALGALVGLDGELAARAIGSEVGYIKGFAQAFFFRRLAGPRHIVLATGVRLGLADGFAREVTRIDENGEVQVDILGDLPASERFFAGGDTTVRGFALDQLGTPETLDPNGFPLGGNAVIVLNAELRVPVWRDLGIAAFMDGGNVFSRVTDISLEDLRGSAGLGLRYRSPIGPLRVDLGFKLDRRVLPNGQLEKPSALHISLGQAF
jgi:outer membrane protein insertion porin family